MFFAGRIETTRVAFITAASLDLAEPESQAPNWDASEALRGNL